jgi:enediyne biosynthesis protein E3
VRWRERVFGIDVAQTRFDVRGFAPSAPAVRAHLEGHAAAFVAGYGAVLADDDVGRLAATLAERVPADRRGFAWEGAAMAATLLDLLPLPGRGRFARLLAGPAAHEPFLLHAGAGWAYARLHRRRWPARAYTPLLRWLPYDGYGFHQVFFGRAGEPRGWPPYAYRAVHQGAGRALWFTCGADPDRVAAAVARCPEPSAGDLWSGVGLAAAYAGGAPDGVLPALAARAGRHGPALAQGAVAATAARVSAGNGNADTARACAQLCGTGVDEAFALYEKALDGLVPEQDPMAYETWRTRVQQHFREDR